MISKNKFFLVVVGFLFAIFFLEAPSIWIQPDSHFVGINSTAASSYKLLLTNPVIQLAICISIMIMLGIFNFMIKPDKQGSVTKKKMVVSLLIIFAVVAIYLLIQNWGYIESNFLPLLGTVLYDARTASSLHMDYYQFKYTMTAPKGAMLAILVPLLIPLLCKLYQLKLKYPLYKKTI